MTVGRAALLDWLVRSRIRSSRLAAELCISRPYMSQIVRGERRPGLEVLVRISDRTGIPPRAWAEDRMSTADRAQILERKTPLLAAS
jgi:transcriptional regulator with XRE-family HTH domain